MHYSEHRFIGLQTAAVLNAYITTRYFNPLQIATSQTICSETRTHRLLKVYLITLQ